jgi:hypothetical protein
VRTRFLAAYRKPEAPVVHACDHCKTELIDKGDPWREHAWVWGVITGQLVALAIILPLSAETTKWSVYSALLGGAALSLYCRWKRKRWQRYEIAHAVQQGAPGDGPRPAGSARA